MPPDNKTKKGGVKKTKTLYVLKFVPFNLEAGFLIPIWGGKILLK